MSFAARVKSIVDIASGIAVILASGVLVWTLLLRPAPASPQSGPQVERVEGLRIGADFIRHQLGSGSITIVEFSDFECPFCRRHATDTFKEIQKDLLESGNVRYAALHFPIQEIHPHADAAAAAAECAGQQRRFWQMREKLFANPKQLATANLLQYSRELELEPVSFEKCLENADTHAIVSADQLEGVRLGVAGTPAFFVGRMQPDGSIKLLTRIKGAVSIGAFKKAIDEAGRES